MFCCSSTLCLWWFSQHYRANSKSVHPQSLKQKVCQLSVTSAMSHLNSAGRIFITTRTDTPSVDQVTAVKLQGRMMEGAHSVTCSPCMMERLTYRPWSLEDVMDSSAAGVTMQPHNEQLSQSTSLLKAFHSLQSSMVNRHASAATN